MPAVDEAQLGSVRGGDDCHMTGSGAGALTVSVLAHPNDLLLKVVQSLHNCTPVQTMHPVVLPVSITCPPMPRAG